MGTNYNNNYYTGWFIVYRDSSVGLLKTTKHWVDLGSIMTSNHQPRKVLNKPAGFFQPSSPETNRWHRPRSGP